MQGSWGEIITMEIEPIGNTYPEAGRLFVCFVKQGCLGGTPLPQVPEASFRGAETGAVKLAPQERLLQGRADTWGPRLRQVFRFLWAYSLK